jgi:glycosyltransferase involved in cell wall biosynthesis
VRIALLGSAAELHTRRWARALSARGATVRVFSLESPAGADEPGPPIDWVRLPAPPLPRALRYPLAVPALARALDAFAPDLVEAHFVPSYGLLGALTGRRPLVVHAWGSDLLLSPGRSPLHALRARFAMGRADLVVVDARVLADAAGRLGVPPARLAVVPWGADLGLFPLAAFMAAPHVVSLRQLEPLYDVACLVDALPAVRARVPRLAVTIAGEGRERTRLEKLARKRGVSECVRFVGRVPHGELPALLASAAVAVSCARSDSTSISLLEAMARGATPVVADIPGNREWVEPGVDGLVFPPGNPAALATALVRALNDPAFRAAARVRARQKIERGGDFAVAVEATLGAYRALVPRGAAA